MSDYTIGSGDIFADLGLSPAEAEEAHVKSGLIQQIADAIESQGLKQMEAAALVGVDQPTLSKVLRGRMGSVSVERLTAWLNKLGYDVTVKVVRKAKAETGNRGHFALEVVG